MYAAIAGLKTHMQNLNVIGNNIANVNTYGYKAARAVFKTSLYTTLTGGSNGTITTGGTNPSQIGYGSTVASVDVDVSSGNYAVTGIATDLMLDGDGFFLVGTKDLVQNFDGTIDDTTALTSLTLTRVGDFQFRADGYLGKNDGNCVYGFLCIGIVTQDMILDENHPMHDKVQGMSEGDAIFSDQLVPIRYPRVEPKKYFLDGVEVTGDTIEEIRAQVYVEGTDQLAEGVTTEGIQIVYPVESEVDGRLYDAGYDEGLKDSVLQQGGFSGISIDPNTGIITATSDDTKEVITIGCIAVGKVTNPSGVTNIGDNYYKASAGSGKLSIAISGGNAEAMGIRQINKSLQTEEEERTIAALTAYSTETHIISNGLEMSKTDLAQEISMMILTQRGYQANTRIITVTDSMLEELVNMKR